jgi:hypothetical protein
MSHDRSTCRMPGCNRTSRGGGGFAGRFCSTKHEVKYDHLKVDAQDAKRGAEREAQEEDRL